MTEIRKRKMDHLRICTQENVQAHSIRTGFEEVFLVHRALPEIGLEEVDLTVDFFSHSLSAPIIIEPMTGGTREATKVNVSLAEAAETLGLAMGVGSQRVAIDNPNISSTFAMIRKKAPSAFLIANLGASQLVGSFSVTDAQKAVDMIEADALAIHLNPLQEVVQPEGTTSHKHVLEKIEEITSSLSIPVIAKETGAGISAEEAIKLEKAGVKGIDVSGAGGTSWAAVEYFRAKETDDKLREKLGKTFWDWGIPTVASIAEVCHSSHLLVIASGGIRTGIHIAKSIALGADATGLAIPLLKPALEGKVIETLRILIDEFRIAMFLVGARTTKELKRSPLIITGRMADWLHLRGLNLQRYARRNDK